MTALTILSAVAAARFKVWNKVTKKWLDIQVLKLELHVVLEKQFSVQIKFWQKEISLQDNMV
jgi:hypothetical protein